MTAAIKTDLRTEILRILQEDIVFQVQDGDQGQNLRPDNIVWQPTRATKNRPDIEQNQMMDMPGLLVSEPLASTTDEPGGTVSRDLYHYRWLIQLIDNPWWENPHRVASWEKWIEQIVAIFMFNCLDSVITLPRGQIWWSNASRVSDIDENSYVRNGQFIEGVELQVKVLQPRGVVT